MSLFQGKNESSLNAMGRKGRTGGQRVLSRNGFSEWAGKQSHELHHSTRASTELVFSRDSFQAQL